ncbi:hypothetical protein P691DRAFT_768316 [Macrolepiota fuliginosa MF-IS2]|uniref:Uncharacterized protein n=1 Tax=Macrolepiota fuliginosa MF-IS2 TaxID=1400762 RepID=A0A9P6BW05_9AGAR|nr:hypothetical protein P691DRAFT_768316 [Macrolepiota fuliginosa MF-IS2]
MTNESTDTPVAPVSLLKDKGNLLNETHAPALLDNGDPPNKTHAPAAPYPLLENNVRLLNEGPLKSSNKGIIEGEGTDEEVSREMASEMSGGDEEDGEGTDCVHSDFISAFVFEERRRPNRAVFFTSSTFRNATGFPEVTYQIYDTFREKFVDLPSFANIDCWYGCNPFLILKQDGLHDKNCPELHSYIGHLTISCIADRDGMTPTDIVSTLPPSSPPPPSIADTNTLSKGIELRIAQLGIKRCCPV